MGAVSQYWMEVQMFPASQTMVFKSFHVNDKVHGKKKNWVMSHSMKDTFRKKHISNSKLLLQNVNVLWQSQVSLNTEWRRKAF